MDPRPGPAIIHLKMTSTNATNLGSDSSHAGAGGLSPHHLAVIAATAATLVRKPVQIQRVVILAAAAAAATALQRPLRGRRVIIHRRPADDPWSIQGRVRLMVTRNPHLN